MSSVTRNIDVVNAVTYNRNAKLFQGQVNGSKAIEATTRIRAEFKLIEAVSPALAGMIQAVCKRAGQDSGKRALRGARIVLTEGIYELEGERNSWLVESESERGKTYRVDHAGGSWYCECADWLNGMNGESYGAPMVAKNGVMCKHTWSAKMLAGLGRRVGGSPPPATWLVKTRAIHNGAQQADVTEAEFDRKGDAEAYAGELARDIRDDWPAQMRRNNGHYKLFRGDSRVFVWAEEVA